MNILITGASRGIGLELTKQYVARGETVFAAMRDPDGNTGAVKLDVTDEGSIAAAVEQVRSKTDSLDLLINNAGVLTTRGGRHMAEFGDLTADEAEAIFRANVIAPFMVAQAFHGLLQKSSKPKIVSITSGYGSVSSNDGSYPLWYAASKAALNMGMRTAAAQLAKDNFTVAVISPGWVKTDMGGPGATLTPEQSVRGMIKVIDELDPSKNGKFLDYRGREIPW
jgi:NAD(P)-dependent dehydrogenase (short-subunit alcohol dehydrogenase family)